MQVVTILKIIIHHRWFETETVYDDVLAQACKWIDKRFLMWQNFRCSNRIMWKIAKL